MESVERDIYVEVSVSTMDKISILSLNFYSFLKQQEWIAKALSDMGYEVFCDLYHPAKLKWVQPPIIFITEERGIDSFVRLCAMQRKKGIAWIDFFVTRRFHGLKWWQHKFRSHGGRIVPIGEFERMWLESQGVITDAKIPRCIPDELFRHRWKGRKRKVLSWGFAHYMEEYERWKHLGVSEELKNVTRKGHELLVKFAVENPEWEVMLVTEVKALEKACSIPQADNLTVVDAGNFTEEEKIEMFVDAGVFCFPTRQDSQGLVLCEAQAMGVPTCYTRLPQQLEVGGGVEIPYKSIETFPDGMRLAIIDYKDVEASIYKTYEHAEFISEYGRENAKRFRASVVAKALVELLES